MRKLTAVVLFWLTLAQSFAADIYVRSGAVGTGSGVNFANAKTQIPTSFTRGDTIWVSAGSGYVIAINRGNIDMASTTPLTIKKPTPSSHGSANDWSDTYTNVADFSGGVNGPVNISASYITVDGVTGGGPGNFTNGLGFRLIDTNPAHTMIMLSDKYGGPSDRVSVTNVLIAHFEMSSVLTPGTGEGVNAVAVDAFYSQIVLSNLWIHDMGSDPLKFSNIDGLTTDGICFQRNGSDATHHNSYLHLNGPCNNGTNRNCWIEGVVGTGGIGGYDNTGTNLFNYNDIFCYPPGGILAGAVSTNWGNGLIYTLNNNGVGINAHNWQNNHCTFVNLPSNPMIGIYETDGSCNAFNNLFVWNESGSGSWNFSGVTLDYNAFFGPSTGSGTHQTALGSNPLTDMNNQDFRLASNITAANPLGGIYAKDIMGNTRSASTPSFGAIEFGSGNPLNGTPGGGGGGTASYNSTATGTHIRSGTRISR